MLEEAVAAVEDSEKKGRGGRVVEGVVGENGDCDVGEVERHVVSVAMDSERWLLRGNLRDVDRWLGRSGIRSSGQVSEAALWEPLADPRNPIGPAQADIGAPAPLNLGKSFGIDRADSGNAGVQEADRVCRVALMLVDAAADAGVSLDAGMVGGRGQLPSLAEESALDGYG